MTNTLRLLVPQWQGGESEAYPMGARLLEWLAPAGDCPTVEIAVEPFDPAPLLSREGVAGLDHLTAHIRDIAARINQHKPDRLVVFGGDCLVSQAPFSYLSKLYGGELGVLWLDAHPDVATAKERSRGHTMVLANLLGRGEPALSEGVTSPIPPERVMMVGLSKLFDYEDDRLTEFGVARIAADDLGDNRGVMDWLRDTGITRLAIHLDLDVLSPQAFRSQGFALPMQKLDSTQLQRSGSMSFDQVASLIRAVSASVDVVGLSITEHLPWDVVNLQKLLKQFPILSG
ncbi:arginase family protein [Pseudotabrizicola sp. 4114]|uniref:arginase family protein n=1 Tax=Pseudotabrizicola sp. 4114 TaxID=2817731 RepID=UPI0028546B74|nr:arginase [Pseudorhodobacter sp. 4114]